MGETWRLFRYKPVNEFLWQELELSQFYCGPPNRLNDPFDCRIDWRLALKRALRAGLSDHRRARLEQMLSAFDRKSPHLEAGVCCFSIKVDDQLMWSHYANSHQGLCLFYEIPSDYFSRRYPPTLAFMDDLFFVGGSQIHYGDDVFYEWLLTGDHDEPLHGNFLENAVSRIFSSKAKCWGHEEEWRMITSQPGILSFEPGFLKQVTFGFAMTQQHRGLVERVARRANLNVVISEVQRSGTKDFGLIFPEVVR